MRINLCQLLLSTLGLLFLYIQAHADAVPDTNSVTIASWNVRNYLLKDRYLEGTYRPDYPKPETRKKSLRRQLLEVSPDILLLQEIGNESFLLELKRDLRADGLHYPYDSLLKIQDEPRALAMLSRIPPQSMLLKNNLDFAYFGKRRRVKRGLMQLRFEHRGVTWSLLHLHLKSRYQTHPKDPNAAIRREREARAIRNYLREKYPPKKSRHPYLILGDFNATADQAPLRRFLNVSDTTLAYEIPLSDPYGTHWTYFHKKSRTYSQVDYALMNPAMKKHKHIRISDARIIPSPEGMPRPSDHRMILVELSFSDQKE